MATILETFAKHTNTVIRYFIPGYWLYLCVSFNSLESFQHLDLSTTAAIFGFIALGPIIFIVYREIFSLLFDYKYHNTTDVNAKGEKLASRINNSYELKNDKLNYMYFKQGNSHTLILIGWITILIFGYYLISDSLISGELQNLTFRILMLIAGIGLFCVGFKTYKIGNVAIDNLFDRGESTTSE